MKGGTVSTVSVSESLLRPSKTVETVIGFFGKSSLTGLKPGENEKFRILEENPDAKLDVTWVVIGDKRSKVRIVSLSQTIKL
jgi:hypothetical protein